MRKTNELSVTVGIPAFNSQTTIKRLLGSIFDQKEKGFRLDKVVVISDGSTDDTVKEALSFTNNRVEVIEDKKNRGRAARRNQFMKLAHSDILLFLDADLFLADHLTISKLIEPFKANSEVAMVGGNPNSVGDNNFLNQSLSTGRDVYTAIRYKIKHGNNVYGCMGGVLALSKKLYTKITIPEHVLADDSYMYFSCLVQGYKFKNVKKATALHPFPSDLHEHILRTIRHGKTTDQLKLYFGELVTKEFSIPSQLFIKSTVEQFIRHPVRTVFIFVVNRYAKILARYEH